MQGWLAQFAIGQLQALKGIAAGITNTNYFVTTDQGRFVLTLFEKANADDLHYFVYNTLGL
jgi:homoserine kinase type II